MTFARIRLVLATGLFVAWIAWLAYLASTTTHPTVVSRPQLLVADLDIVAEIKANGDHPDPTVHVVEILWPKSARDQNLKEMHVANLADLSKANGWRGPGTYLVPLRKSQENNHGDYEVAALPSSPGFPPRYSNEKPILSRIYPDTPETRSQFERIRSGHWEE